MSGSHFRTIFFLNSSSNTSQKARRLHVILVASNWFYIFLLLVSVAFVMAPYYLDYRRYDWVFVMRYCGYGLMGVAILGFFFNSAFLRRWYYSELVGNTSQASRVNQVAVAEFQPSQSSYPPQQYDSQVGYPPMYSAYPPPAPGQPAQPVLPPSYSSLGFHPTAGKIEGDGSRNPPPPYYSGPQG